MERDLRQVIDLDVVAAALEKAKREGGGFDPTWFDDLLVALTFHVPLDDSASERDRLALCSEAVSAVAQSGTITKPRLKAELARRSRRFLAQPKQPYVLLTGLSCTYFVGLAPRALDGWTLRFSSGCPPRFDRKHVPDYEWAKYEDWYRWLTHVRVSGRARTVHEALDAGLERLDCVRGIWNLVRNRRLWSQSTNREGRPLNKLRVGPIHTVHLPNGKPAEELWWYELSPSREPVETNLERGWQGLEMEARAIRAALTETPLGPDLRKIIVRYCRALDGGDYDLVLLQLWSILETLTATSRDGYDATIARVRFLYGDNELVRYILEMSRERRNRTAHVGAGAIDARKSAIRLHRLVTRLITFAIAVSGKFDSLKEFGQFLAMPRDVAKLEHEISVRRTALRFRRSGSIGGRRLMRR